MSELVKKAVKRWLELDRTYRSPESDVPLAALKEQMNQGEIEQFRREIKAIRSER